jgi:hypothetical protein
MPAAMTNTESDIDESSLDAPSLEKLYVQAHGLLAQARYVEAEKIFRLLVVQSPFDPRFLSGHAASLAGKGDHRAALLLHTLHYTLNMGDADAGMGICEALIALGHKNEARDALQCVMHGRENHTHGARRAQALLKLIGPNGEIQ